MIHTGDCIEVMRTMPADSVDAVVTDPPYGLSSHRKGGLHVILDPFLGSGSTAVAAEREGVKWIGIEKEPEYVAIAEARLNGTQRGLGLDVGAPTRRSKGRPETYEEDTDRLEWRREVTLGDPFTGIRPKGEEPAA